MLTADAHRAMKRLGYKIAAERSRKHLSQLEVAKATKHSVTTVATIENGNNCNIASIMDVLIFLGCEIELRRQ